MRQEGMNTSANGMDHPWGLLQNAAARLPDLAALAAVAEHDSYVHVPVLCWWPTQPLLSAAMLGSVSLG